jgi:hypothetical protein
MFSDIYFRMAGWFGAEVRRVRCVTGKFGGVGVAGSRRESGRTAVRRWALLVGLFWVGSKPRPLERGRLQVLLGELRGLDLGVWGAAVLRPNIWDGWLEIEHG